MAIDRKAIPSIPPQGSRFIDAARELGCDESEERFDAALKQIAKAKPKPSENDSGPADPA